MPKRKYDNSNGRFPNLICPGAQKAGSSSLYVLLRQHPDISPGSTKEIKYFNNFYHRGDAWYKQMADTGADAKYIMDITPGYMVEEKWVQRIKDTLGDDAFFIILLRNPVDRMYSTYNMYLHGGYNPENDVKKAFDKDYKGYLSGKGKTNYFKHGLYAKQVKYFQDRFSSDKIKIVLLEDFVSDTKAVVLDILDFLKLPVPADMKFDIWANKAKEETNLKKVRMKRIFVEMIPKSIRNRMPMKLEKFVRKILHKSSDRKVLAGYEKDPALCNEYMEKYLDDIKNLEKLIGRDLSIWTDKYITQ